MKVAIDMDGTITTNPEFFMDLINDLRLHSTVYILTGRMAEDEDDEEDAVNPPRRVEQLREMGFKRYQPEWGPTIIEISRLKYLDIAKAKGRFCLDYNIDMVIEDNMHYLGWIQLISPRTQCFLIVPNWRMANLNTSH